MRDSRQSKSRFTLILIILLAVAGMLVFAYTFSNSMAAASNPSGFDTNPYMHAGGYMPLHNVSTNPVECEECHCPAVKTPPPSSSSSPSLAVELPPYFQSIKAKPLFGASHSPSKNAVFALAMRYDADVFTQFVQSARNWGYKGDIVLGVSDYVETRSGRGARVADLIEKHNVVAYAVKTSCSGGAVPNCKLLEWFDDEAAYEKAKPRPLQMLRYELYLSWALQYSSSSLLLNIDFRDTIFQGDPFAVVPKPPPFDIAFFSEYYPNKKIAFCPFNGGWIRSCFGTVPPFPAPSSLLSLLYFHRCSLLSGVVGCVRAGEGRRGAVLRLHDGHQGRHAALLEPDAQGARQDGLCGEGHRPGHPQLPPLQLPVPAGQGVGVPAGSRTREHDRRQFVSLFFHPFILLVCTQCTRTTGTSTRASWTSTGSCGTRTASSSTGAGSALRSSTSSTGSRTSSGGPRGRCPATRVDRSLSERVGKRERKD